MSGKVCAHIYRLFNHQHNYFPLYPENPEIGGYPDSDNLNCIMAYFTPGQLLKKGQYEIIDTLGQGGFGITYLAQDHKRKKQVAEVGR